MCPQDSDPRTGNGPAHPSTTPDPDPCSYELFNSGEAANGVPAQPDGFTDLHGFNNSSVHYLITAGPLARALWRRVPHCGPCCPHPSPPGIFEAGDPPTASLLHLAPQRRSHLRTPRPSDSPHCVQTTSATNVIDLGKKENTQSPSNLHIAGPVRANPRARTVIRA